MRIEVQSWGRDSLVQRHEGILLQRLMDNGNHHDDEKLTSACDMTAKTNQSPADRTNTDCWVISDGVAGNQAQALALARTLGLTPRIISLQLSRPWDWLAPRLRLAAAHGMRDRNGGTVAAPWPSIAIGCGRRAALLTRCLRDWSDHRCFTVQILDPRIATSHFDVVIAPQHDRLVGDNVIETRGGLNAIDDAWLADGRGRFASFSELPKPRTAVLIGATHPSMALDDAYFDALLGILEQLRARLGGSFLVSTSRRTPVDRVDALRKQFLRWPGIFWGGPADGANPYAGILGWADQFIVTGDSVNMISEACATGKPVHAFAPVAATGKLDRFHLSLFESGHLVTIDGLESPGSVAPLRETGSVGEQIRQRRMLASPN